jgi:hypothetical protein
VRAMGPVVSNTCMRRMILTVWLLILTGCLWAQAPSASDSEKAAIQRAKNALVSSFDSSLPKVSLEFFLNYESGGGPIQWEVNDCGKKIGNPAADRGSDSPMCVVADFEKDRRHCPYFRRNVAARAVGRSRALPGDRQRPKREKPCPSPGRSAQGIASPDTRDAPRFVPYYCFF